MNLTDRLAAPSWKPFANRFYPLLTRRLGADDLTLLNWGYEEDPPMAVPLATSDEPDRFCIQLYHRTATQAQLGGQRILEVSCGHGGGAAYLVRTLRPASYTGLDLNAAGIDYCRKKHQLPGLNFVNGDAEDLPFTDDSFDAVINVEASHCYPGFPRFLGEVARVLRPGGHFLYTDMRPRDRIAEWEAELAGAPMRMLSHAAINEQVIRGMEKNVPRSQDMWARNAPAFLRGIVRKVVNASNSKFCRRLRCGHISYRMYSFAKD